MKINLKLCTDPKHLAWVSWTLLANNPVNITTYLLFCMADLLIIMFYSFILIQRVHFQNFDYPQTNNNDANSDSELYQLSMVGFDKDKGYQGGGIQLTFLRKIDYQLNNLIRDYSQTLLIFTIAILGLSLIILMIIMILALVIKNHADLEKPSFLKKSFCFILVSLLTFVHMPMFDVIIRTIIASYEASNNDLSILIIRYSICGVTILVFAVVMLYLVRIFNVCVPTELIPWCAPISKISILNLVIKAGLVICNAFDIDGQFALIEILIFFVLQGFQACYRVLFAPNYIKEVDLFVKTKDFAICLIFFIGIVCKGLTDRTNYDMVYFIFFIPVVTVGWILFEVYRKQNILLGVKNKSLKMEVENEFALYVMMTLVRDSVNDNSGAQKIFGQLMDLMLTHIEDCDDQLCICDEMENFYELLRLRQLHNQEVFPLLRKERKRFKKIIDDQGLIGTVSNITDITLKINSTESTTNKTNGDSNNEKLDRNAEDDDELHHRRNFDEDDNNQDEDAKARKKNSNDAYQAAKKKRNSTIYKINIDETKHRFLSELLYLFYFEMIKKFPDSFKIQLLSNYFALLYKRKEMLCVFQMRSFNKQRLSKLDQCCHQINEQYLLYEISKVQKVNMHSSDNQQDGNFNGDYFIQMNQLYKELNLTIEVLSSSVVNFWKIFERPSIDVEGTHNCGTGISKNIQHVFRVFNQLDSLKIFKDYQMYFQFAIVQLHILNDPVAYELYIGKMKSILDINKVYQKNFSQSGNNNTDQANFIIVDANGIKFGQILQVNNGLRLLLGWGADDEKRFTIENFMPGLIRERHSEFMNRYNKTGQSYIINNKTTMFVRKNNGYVIPVELYIKFHYSIDYQYTFLAIMKPFYEMAPFANGVKYNINQLIFLVVDHEEDGRITEFSESCIKMLGSYGFKKEMEQNGIIKRISDIIMEFDFLKIRETRQDRYQTNEIYEQVHRLDLNNFDDTNSMSHEHNKKVGNLLASLLLNNGGIVNARTRIFEERYSGGVLDMNIFCFAILSDGDGAGSVIKNSSVGNQLQSQMMSSQNGKDKNAQRESVSLDDYNDKNDDRSQSATGSSTSSMRDSTTSMAEFRNFHSFTEQATPKTLTLIIRLIIALYFIMVIIASVNLGINITRQVESEQDVHTVRQAFDRINWVSMNQLLVRVLVNIANGYEPEDSLLVEDRFKKYASLQEDRVQQLKNTQSLLQRNQFLSSDEFTQFKEGKNVPLYYLSESNQIYTKYETLNVAYNLYIAKLTEMNSYTKQDLIGNLSIQTLNAEVGSDYKPSYFEQSIFFIVQNGNKELRQFSIDATTFYGRESELHAEQNIVSTKITAIISIIVIVIIGLIIAPIMTTAEIRKYKALLYFLKIPKEKFGELIKNCAYCLNMNDEARYYQIMKDYESFLGIKLVNQQVEQLRQAKDEKSNIDNQASRAESSGGPKSSDIISNSQGVGGEDVGSMASSRNKKHQSQFQHSGIANEDDLDSQNLNLRGSQINHNTSQGKRSVISASGHSDHSDSHHHHDSTLDQAKRAARQKLKATIANNQKGLAQVSENEEENENEMMDHNNEHDADQEMDIKDETENDNKFNLKNLNIRQEKGGHHQKTRAEKRLQQEAGGEELRSMDEIEEDNQEQNEVTSKMKLINAQAYKRRSVMIFSSLSIILCLSTYFIIAYFLAMKTFETASLVIESLEGIFYKGTCFDSAMNFLRESEIRNQSMMIHSTINTQNIKGGQMLVATDYYLDFCFKKEDQYNRMRVSMPKFFEKAAPYINAMESSNMCEHIYTGDFAPLQQKCKDALNGILNKGLTNAFYHMFTQILKANLNFQSMEESGTRNKANLERMLLDQQIVQIIDMKAQVLDPALNQLKQQCMQSVIEYIQMLLNNFITAFIVFIAILTFSVAVVAVAGFKILRKSMWDTNIILKIIPFETLPKQDRIEIKDFFNS